MKQGIGKQQHQPVLPLVAARSVTAPRLHAIMVSEYTQSSLQLGAGMFVACLFTYVLPISFPPMSCVAATWLCVVAVMASPANHLGVRITSACNVLGSTWVGAVLAAVVVSLSHLAGPVFSPQGTAVLGVLAPTVLAVLAPVRVAASPPLLWSQGMNACLSFGLTALSTYTREGHDTVWYLAGTLVLVNAIACVVVVLVAALITPTHASEEVQATIADVLLHSGVATSRYAGRLFRPIQHNVFGGKDTGFGGKDTGAGLYQSSYSSTAPQLPTKQNNGTAAGFSTAVASSPSTASVAAPGVQQPGGQAVAPGSVGALLIPPEQGNNRSTGPDVTAVHAVTDGESAQAVLAAADAAFEQLAAADIGQGVSGGYDAAVEVEPAFPGGSNGQGIEPLPLVMHEAHTEQEWLQLMRRTSAVKLSAPDASSHPKPQPPIATLRPRLAKAQNLFTAAAGVEPQWLRGGWSTVVGRPGCYWFDKTAWGKAGGCLQLLLTRLSALEAVIEDGESLHISQHPNVNADLLDHLSMVYSKAASSLAHMSHTVRAYGSKGDPLNALTAPLPGSAAPAGLDRPQQHAGEPAMGQDPELQAGQQQQQQVQPQQQKLLQQEPQQQSRQQHQQPPAAGLSAAAVGALCGRAAGDPHCWQRAKADLAALMQEECEGHWLDVMQAAPDSPVVLPTLTGVRHIMFTWSLTQAIIDSMIDLEEAVAAAVCASPQPQSAAVCASPKPQSAPSASGFSGLPNRLFGWVVPCLPMLTGRNQAVHWYQTLACGLPRWFRQGWPGVQEMVRSPVFQAGFKYWVVLVIVFEVTLAVLYSWPVTRPLNPSFGFVAASLTMSDKVEATVSKFVFWVVGTILGGALGFLAMWHPALASNPFGLMAVVVAAALVVGLLGLTKARVAITLLLMTLSTLILCQCCGHEGHWPVAISRVASVLFGVTSAVLVCNCVLPWYTSAWSIQTMRSTFITAVMLVNQMHAQFYADGAAAAVAYEARTFPCPRVEASKTTSASSPSQETDRATSPPAAAASRAAAQESGDLSTKSQASTMAAAAVHAAAQVAEAAAAASVLVACKGQQTCPVYVTPAVLQTVIARPLVAVQTSLLMDTVAWQRGVLATPPVVPAMLRAMFGLLDRLAALQLGLQPYAITRAPTGVIMVNYGVPMAGKLCECLQLCGRLAAAVAAVLEEPSCEHSQDVHDALRALQSHRVTMYTHMQQLRQQLHIDIHRQHRRLQQLLREQAAMQQQRQQGPSAVLDAEICPVKRQMEAILGGVDDTVRYLGFQFASIKAFNMIAAVATVATQDVCRKRSTAACTLK